MLKQEFKKNYSNLLSSFNTLKLYNLDFILTFLELSYYETLVLITHVLKKETILKKIVDLFFEDSIMLAGVNEGHFCTLR